MLIEKQCNDEARCCSSRALGFNARASLLSRDSLDARPGCLFRFQAFTSTLKDLAVTRRLTSAMGYVILFAAWLTVNGPALAQKRPSLTWQGEVTGGATLFIQGNRVDVEGRDTGAVDRPTYRFRDMLPAAAQTVEMRVVRGRGRVVIAEQPSA